MKTKKKYQKPTCEIYEIQSEGVLAASGRISRETAVRLPEVKTFWSSNK
jgi:hypothetical protein